MDPHKPGLRQQKKEATRARIAAAAMDLFLERGFEQVSVVEIAAKAGVTEKTIFNHFGTKVDLAFPEDPVAEAALLNALQSRPAGTSVLAAFRSFALDAYRWHFPRDANARQREAQIAVLVDASPALHTWKREMLARYASHVRDQLVIELGTDSSDLRPAVVANSLIAVHEAVLDSYRDGLVGSESPTALSRRIRRAAAQAFDLLAEGLDNYASHAAPTGEDSLD